MLLHFGYPRRVELYVDDQITSASDLLLLKGFYDRAEMGSRNGVSFKYKDRFS